MSTTANVTEDLASFENDILGREVGSEDTAGRYARWAARFEAWRSADEPNSEMLRDFDSFLENDEVPDYPWENARGLSAPPSYAFQTRVTALSGTKLWLDYQYGIRVEKKVQNLALGEPDDFDPTILSQSEVGEVVSNADAACDNPDCKTAIMVGYDAILRGAELADVRAEDLNPEDRSLYVRAKKGSENRNVALDSNTWNALKRHADQHPDRDHLFRNAYDRAWNAAAWNQHFRRKHHEAGFHAFARHSAITNRLRQGEDFGQVFIRARHAHPTTTLKYVDHAGVDAPDWVGQL